MDIVDADGRLALVEKRRLSDNYRWYYYVVTNSRGDVLEIHNGPGELTAKYTYDAWGKLISVKNASGAALSTSSFAYQISVRYRGYVYDSETGLYYLQSRYYDPETGRFLNADDVGYIGLSGTDTSYNAFAYCENNPVNDSDPSGTLSLNANWFGFVLDIALTAIASWFKFSYDIIGAGLSYYARKKGIKLFYERLMYGVVPKVRRMFSSSFTLLRKAIWRSVGNVSGNAISSFLATGLQKITVYFARLAKMKKLGNMFYLASRMLTMGSLVALVLDWASDGNPYNERIRIW